MQLLNLSNGFTEADLKRAYRKMSKKYHPDIAGQSGKDLFIQVSNAFELLSNPRVIQPKTLYTHGSIFKVVKK